MNSVVVRKFIRHIILVSISQSVIDHVNEVWRFDLLLFVQYIRFDETWNCFNTEVSSDIVVEF